MPGRKVQPRVHLHGRRAGNVEHLYRIASALNYTDFDPNTFLQGGKLPVKKAEAHRKPVKEPVPFTLGGTSTDSSEEAVYEELDEEVEPEQLCITKQPVSSLEEQERNGLRKSSLGAAIENSRVSPPAFQSFPSFGDDSAEWPSVSSVVNTNVSIHDGEELPEERRSLALEQLRQTQSRPKSKSSPRSLHQTIVQLFAGRRSPNRSAQVKQRCENEPVLDENHRMFWSEEEEQAVDDCSSYTAAKPPLLLPNIIPDARPCVVVLTQCADEYEFFMRRREHPLTGTADIQPDNFAPEQVQRGFITTQGTEPITPPTTPPLSPLAYRAHKQGNSAAKLLDRDSRAWAGWHDKYPSCDKMPFTKKPSVEADLYENSGHADGGSSGTCYLQHTGDNYPYAQGRCW